MGSLAQDPTAAAPCLASRPSLVAFASHDAVARGVSPYPVDDDGSGRAEHQGCHDEDGGQDDQDDDPDVQDVLGESAEICWISHPARERQRGDGAAPSTPPIARTPPHCSKHPTALSRETPVATSTLGLLQEQRALVKTPLRSPRIYSVL